MLRLAEMSAPIEINISLCVKILIWNEIKTRIDQNWEMNHCTFTEVSTPMEINMTQNNETLFWKEDKHVFSIPRGLSYSTCIVNSLDSFSETNALLTDYSKAI